MNTLEAINRRKSVRSFTGQAPDDERLQKILKAGEEAPVGMGKYEDVHLTVIRDKTILKSIGDNAAAMMGRPGMDPLYGAPVLVLVSVRKPEPMMVNVAYSNAAVIVENMALAAADLGVGACHIWGAVAPIQRSQDVMASLKLPENFVPACGIALGATEESYDARAIDDKRIAVDYLG